MQKQNKKQNTQQASNKGGQAMQNTQNTQQNKVTLVDKVIAKVQEASKQDKNITITKVTGHYSIKYGNTALFELHAKQKAISHLTFGQGQKAYAILKSKNLIYRVVPKTYGWKLDTECMLTDDMFKNFDAIFKSVIAEAVEARNLKQAKADKQAEKQAKKQVKA